MYICTKSFFFFLMKHNYKLKTKDLILLSQRRGLYHCTNPTRIPLGDGDRVTEELDVPSDRLLEPSCPGTELGQTATLTGPGVG